MVLLWCECEDT